jgi:hypothetical protein
MAKDCCKLSLAAKLRRALLLQMTVKDATNEQTNRQQPGLEFQLAHCSGSCHAPVPFASVAYCTSQNSR